MKVEDYEAVKYILSTREKVTQAIKDADDYIASYDAEPSLSQFPSYVPGYGFWSAFATHKDGSGAGINMTGCYVGREVATAAREILTTKLQTLNDSLTKLGVEL